MKAFLQMIPAWVFLVICTTCEVSGDALVRRAIYEYSGTTRVLMMLSGTALLFAYGFTLNLAPIEFGRVVGLYIATLFIVWQITTYLTFHTMPRLPIIVGGVLIVTGGLIMTYWSPSPLPHQ